MALLLLAPAASSSFCCSFLAAFVFCTLSVAFLTRPDTEPRKCSAA